MGQGPGGVWCDVDVVEFSYFGAPAPTPKEQLYTELIDGLTGSDPCIGSGSQVIFSSLTKLPFHVLVKFQGKHLFTEHNGSYSTQFWRILEYTMTEH